MCLVLAAPSPAEAYIGPGAGFALLSSLVALVTTVLVAGLTLVLWPFRKLWQFARRPRRARSFARRVIVVGLEGQDPGPTDRLMAEGKLPNFLRLAEAGGFRRLRTSAPPVSSVAWSSLSTGMNPGRHNVFDCGDRDRATGLPMLSTTAPVAPGRVLRIGHYRIPIGQSGPRARSRARPFWFALGEHGVWSTVLGVPVPLGPGRFHGAQLAAALDLRGTPGSFTLFTTRPDGDPTVESGRRVAVEVRGDRIETTLSGPVNSYVADGVVLGAELSIALNRPGMEATAELGGTRVTLRPGRMSEWTKVSFRALPGIWVFGMCRLLLLELGEHVTLYVTAINIDPERPAMAISYPRLYASYLAKRVGKFGTLGAADDRDEGSASVIGPAALRQQAYDFDRERETMFFAALGRLRTGALVCVFEATDRIQHLYWGDLAEIEQLYRHNDALVGRIMQSLSPDDVLLVVSVHGFASCRRALSLNSWLREKGYLVLKPGADGSGEWLRDVDWRRTRAYALGRTGVFINLQGREAAGSVSPADAAALKAEITSALRGLVDADTGKIAVTEVFESASLYAGPHRANAPDLVVGCNAGYRLSPESARGVVLGPVFEDNQPSWAGDHAVDPRLVPGVLFSNRRIDAGDPGIMDIAPTVLRTLGVEPPPEMEGTALFDFTADRAGRDRGETS